ELARYHDIAASTKTRGQGIGFAGVGIKLGLLICDQVLTETRRGKTHVASDWHLASRHRAPWKWVPPAGLLSARGTAVRLRLQNPLSPLLDGGFIETALRRHYEALLDPGFAAILGTHYGQGVRFEVGGRVLEREARDAEETAPLEVRLGRKRKPAALGYMVRASHALHEDRRGVARRPRPRAGRDGPGRRVPAARDAGGTSSRHPAAAADGTRPGGGRGLRARDRSAPAGARDDTSLPAAIGATFRIRARSGHA